MIKRNCQACGFVYEDESSSEWSTCPKCGEKVGICPHRIVKLKGENYVSYWNPYAGKWEEPDRLAKRWFD